MPEVEKKIDITIARGDGIGPEIMAATLLILEKAKARLTIHEIEIGEKVYLKGFPTGIEPKSWHLIRQTGAFLKAPITTPQGGGFRSLNVSIRTALGLYANIRPCIALHPYVATKHPGMDVVIIRENEEDLYTGIEYRQTEDSFHALKIITRKGCERIIRYAFEYARHHKRKKVTAFTKDNILKLTDGLFHKIFDEIAKEYPDIESEHWIVDIGSAKLADRPENFDVIVLPNLYGDILSDVTAQIAGSVGLAGSANIGQKGAMFEAIHGSAPRRAGQNLANPSGLLMAACMMLEHIGQPETAKLIHNAWLKTIEDGIHTYDIYTENVSRQKVGTKEFAEAIVERLGQKPKHLKEAQSATPMEQKIAILTQKIPEEKHLVGVDIFISSLDNPLPLIQKALSGFKALSLSMIANRGLVVFPKTEGLQDVEMSDLWRCRFMGENSTSEALLELYKKLHTADLEVTKQENLYTFGKENIPGYSVSL